MFAVNVIKLSRVLIYKNSRFNYLSYFNIFQGKE